MNRPYSAVSCILMALSLAICTNFVSSAMGDRFVHMRETVQNQRNMLKGQPTLLDGEPKVFPQFYNRLLFPGIFWIVSRAGIFPRDTESYLFTRFFNALALFLTFLLIVKRAFRADFRIAVIGAGLVMYAYIFTFNHAWEITSDYFDGIFTCLFLLLALERKHALLFAITILASFNRESSVFAGVLWFVLYGVSRTRRIQWRETLYAAALCISSYAAVIGIRVAVLGPRDTFGPDSQAVLGPTWWWKQVAGFLHGPTPSSWPVLGFAMLTPILWWIWINREFMQETQARLLWAAAVIGGITFFFGKMDELRVFIPVLMVLIFTCVWLEVLRSQSRIGGIVSSETRASA
jgi:hypothetical protein